MGCGPEVAGSVYHPRQPQQTPFYQLVQRFYPQFEAVYPERYQERYGFWRPIIGTVVRKFLECGDLQQGFARVRCSECREEFFVPYSCRVRCFCPSCHEKRALEKACWVAEHVCADAPDRQFVFTIPKRLRIYFRFERRLLGELCRAAARTVITVYRSAGGRPDAVPGVVGAIQTFGQWSGIPTKPAASGHSGSRRALRERAFPLTRPRRARPAKAGPPCSSRSTKPTRFCVPAVGRRWALLPSSSGTRPRSSRRFSGMAGCGKNEDRHRRQSRR